MITMARIQGSAMGYAGFQKPVIQLGQDGSFSAGPIGAGVTPGPGFNGPTDFNQNFPSFQYPGYQRNYAFPVQEVPVPTPAPTPAPTQTPTWVIVAGSVAAGAVLTYLITRKN
jgi:hypothetical protein